MKNFDTDKPVSLPLQLGVKRSAAGLPYMIASTVVFASVWALIRYASESLDTLQIVFFRQLIGMLAVLPLLWRGGFGVLRTHRMGAHLIRAMSGVIAAYLTFVAIALIPLADAVAFSYAAPLFTTLVAIAFLGEDVRMRRLVAVAVGVVGMLVVLRPGAQALAWGHMFALGAALFGAISMISIRQLAITEHPQTIVFYNFFLALPLCLVAFLLLSDWPPLEGLVVLTAIGLGAFLSQMLIVRAFALSETSTLMPFDFLRLIIVAAYGYFLFGEAIDSYTVVGGLVILASTLYLAHRERQERP